jgi:dolichyl-phosphate beta-glucosyltransferase
MGPSPLSVVLPAYNEEDRLPKTLARLREWQPSRFGPVQIIVVDDGSKDSTISVIKAHMPRDPRLELVAAPHGGAMSALLHGYRKAAHELIGNMEADCATDPSEFERLLPHLEGCDIVSGSRQLRGDLPPIKGKSLFRRVMSKTLSLLFAGLFRCGVRDPQIGFKLFRREALLRALPLLRSPHDGIKSAEILVKAHGLGYRIKEVPVLYEHDDASRLVPRNPTRVVIGVLVALFGVWLEAAREYSQGVLSTPPVRGQALARLLNLMCPREANP